MPETAQPKWRRRADDRPEEVLDAALRQFVRNGFAATKVEDIAADAGLSKGAIYRYFSGKEDIFEQLVKRALTPVAERGLELARTSTQPPPVLLKAILTMVMERLADPDTMALPRLVLMEAGRFPALAAAYRRQVIDRALDALGTIIQRGIEEGVFRPVDSQLAIRNIIGPILAHALLQQIFGIRAGEDITSESLVEAHLDILLNGLSAHRDGG